MTGPFQDFNPNTPITATWLNGVDAFVNGAQGIGSPTGSSLVGFSQSGAGAVARTVQDKLRETVSIKDFGGTGNGTTEDTAAFLAAIAALPNGGCIHFPAGTYILAPVVITTSNIVIRGEGRGVTTLKLKDAQYSTFILFYGVLGGEASDFTLDGNRTNNASGTDKVGLQGARCRNVSFHDLYIKDVYGKGCGFDGGPVGLESQDNCIYAVEITNCNEQAIIVDGSSGTNQRTVISNFLIHDTGHAGIAVNDGASDVAISNGVMNLNNSVWDCVATRNVKRVAVSDVIGANGRNGLYVQYDTNPCEDITVSNCQFISNQQNGVLGLSGTRVVLMNVTAKNNNQGNVSASGFNISKGSGGPDSSYTTMIGCNSIDDQLTPTQTYGYTFSGSPTKTLISGCNAAGNVSGPINIPGTVAVGDMMILPGAGIDMRDKLKWTVTSAYGNLLEFWRTTEANPRFAIDALGNLQFGAGGAVAPDVNLGRAGTNLLKTDDKFLAAGLGIGLSATGISTQATTPSGNTAYKLAIYNAADNTLLGYIPIYAAPW